MEFITNNGEFQWFNLRRKKIENLFERDPFHFAIEKIFQNGNHNQLYPPLLDGFKRTEKARTGGTIIFINESNVNQMKLIPKYNINIDFPNISTYSTLKTNHFYQKISDYFYYFSQIDGAVLITEAGIKGYGVKIFTKINQTEFPDEIKNKGTRYQSAYSLVHKSDQPLLVIVISSDKGIT